MLIRSQDKKQLINFDNVTRLSACKIYGKNETDWLIEADSQPFRGNIGQYSSEEKAIKVLDKIQTSYELSCYSEHAFDNSAQVQRPFTFVNNYTFNMPADKEVEG